MAQIAGSRLLIIAGVAGLIGAVSIVLYLTALEEKYKKAAEPEIEATVRVIVPRENLRAGDRLEKSKLAARSIPEKFAPAHVLKASQVEDVVDRTLLTSVQRGRPMTMYAISSTKSRRFSDTVELGKRARSIKVTRVESFDGLLRPGDKIDLMGTFRLRDLYASLGNASGQQGFAQTVSEEGVMPVLENVEVIEAARVDVNGRRYDYRDNADSRDGFELEFSLITLALTPKQIARVELAETTGDVFAVLRNVADTTTTNFDLIQLDELLKPDVPPAVDLVIGEDGTPVGKVVGDKVVDRNGNIIGRIVDGKAVGLDGESLGSIVRDVADDDPINRVAEVADVVRDATGKIIGRVVDGQVVDRAGNVIGTVEGGVAIGLDGRTLGSIDKNVALDRDGNEVNLSGSAVTSDLVVDDQGVPIGRVVGDSILDEAGNVIGKVVNGKAVSLSGKPLGRILKDVALDDPITRVKEVVDVVRDESGNIVGKIIDGKVIDNAGNVIGTVENGVAVGLDGQRLGEIDRGVALDENGDEVVLDGSVMSNDVVRVEQVVRDKNGNVIGRVVDGKVLDSQGNVVGTVDENGVARDMQGRVVGRVVNAAVNAAGEVVATEKQVVRDEKGKIIGFVEDGLVVDAQGNVIGEIDSQGRAVDASGAVLGKVVSAMVDANGDVTAELRDGVMVDRNGTPLEKTVALVRGRDGRVIGQLVDGKVVDSTGKVVGELRDGQIINDRGEVIASGVTISTEAESVAVEMLDETRKATITNTSPSVIDFIAGGTASDGITPVTKVQLQ